MGSFSERHGHVTERGLQVDTMDDDLKRRISDAIHENFYRVPVRPAWTRWVKRDVAELDFIHGADSETYTKTHTPTTD